MGGGGLVGEKYGVSYFFEGGGPICEFTFKKNFSNGFYQLILHFLKGFLLLFLL